MQARGMDGTLLLYNSFSGAFIQFKGTEADYVATILNNQYIEEPKGILSLFAKQGLLIPCTTDEIELARRLHELPFKLDERLHLHLIPTESCNFRCAYCYEEHKSIRMSDEIIDSIVHLVQRKSSKLRFLSISWFGGEPLIAFDIIDKLSHKMLAICKENQIEYSAGISTNGYLLTDQLAVHCLSVNISNFQITLDGPAETHNKLRVLANGDGTFNTILANLCNLRDKKEDFHIRIRVNFTSDMISHLPKFLKLIGTEFGGDSRFSIHFRPVVYLGGEHNHSVKMCDHTTAIRHQIQLMKLAFNEGFGLNAWRGSMRLYGSVCYAADPRSFVIGTDGRIYKCTVAFDDLRNQIGSISEDGNMNIREDLYRLWTLSGEEIDADCQLCAFRPACQGNLCPLERLNRGGKTCPIVKTNLNECLPLLATEAIMAKAD